MRRSIVLIRHNRALLKLSIMAVATFSALIFLALTALPLGTLSIKGSWFDQFVSQAVSRSYGLTIEIRNIRLLDLKTLSFDSATATSKTGKLLISTKEGLYRLESIHTKKKFSIAGALFLRDVAFSKDYYKRSCLISKPFRYLMNKPILVKSMKVQIGLGRHDTLFEVQECESKDIAINGRLTLRGHRIIEDKLSVSCSPLILLKNIF